MKLKNKIICSVIAFSALVSCDSYLDINEDPNNPVITSVTPDLMLAAAQVTTGNVYASRLNRLGATFSGAWGGNVLTTADPFGTEFRYDITSTFLNDIWDNLFVRTANLTLIENYSGENNYDNHKAIAKILKAFYFQTLVDLYGDIPYFGKHQFTNQLQVTYDDDAVIYADLLEELNEAVAIINNNTGAETVGVEDAIYGGNMQLWEKFANTIKLRLIVRQSNVISIQDAQNALSGLTTADFISFGEAVTLNPGYAKENNRQNPFYENFGFSPDGATVRNRTIVASKYSIEVLDGTTSGVYDNRIEKMYKTDNIGNYVGIEQGQTLSGLVNNNGLSLLGEAFGVDQESVANASKDLYLMTESESFFLQAEAISRGFITGSLQAAFDNGIRASFLQTGITNNTLINNYIANIDSVSGFGLLGSADDIEAIMMQKWIALNTFGGVEPWLDMTRTGYPNPPLPLNQSNTQRPVKLLYPISEIQGNSANVPSQTTSDAFVNSVFWN